MVSLHLFQRGVLYFTVKGGNFLPLIKHGMDVYYYNKNVMNRAPGRECNRFLFPLVCYDDMGTEWTIYSELGCADVIAMLTWILIAFHTLVSIFFLVKNCGTDKGSPDFLAGMESGCCGAGAVFVSMGSYDVEVEVHRKQANPKWRRGMRYLTAIFQFVIVIFICSAIRIVTGYAGVAVDDVQRSSLFLYLYALFLNLLTMTEHIFEGFSFSFV
ncbi:UNVERIFIED_CONTAM: hypothetical protein HDU68_004388 [Siphonaria sp. JEL0065]|nr:hypothetical protein HDU68_004388 [Siphonaria sp. JEL0065]